MARRYDIGSLRSPSKTPQGYLRADAYISRAGVFEYRNADGTVRKEYRPASEVFKGDSLASFALAPLTNDHPPESLTPANTKQYQVGTVGENVGRDGDLVRASVLVTDAKAIADMEAGKNALSCGYDCDVIDQPGVFDGIRYDCMQTNITGNHLAIVDVARAGKAVQARMDGAEQTTTEIKRIPMVEKVVRIDQIDFTMGEQAAQAVSKVLARVDAAEAQARVCEAANASLKTDLAKAQARADAAEADAAKVRAESIDPARLSTLVAARTGLESRARTVLGEGSRFDGQSDLDVKVKVLGKLAPSYKPDLTRPVYLEARYDAEIAIFERSNPALEALRVNAEILPTEGEIENVRTDGESKEFAARQKMIAELETRWKRPQ